MPSTTKKQAHFMSAIAHGWRPKDPRHKLPPLSVAEEFHAADKRVGKWEHAKGGYVSPLDAVVGDPMKLPRVSGGIYLPSTARARMPHISIPDTLKRIDSAVKAARIKLPRIDSKTKSFSISPRVHMPKYTRGGRT